MTSRFGRPRNSIWLVEPSSLNGPVAGYQKALEHGNSVPRPRGFCAANKLKLSTVLSQNPKCCNLRLIDILIFNRPGVAGAVL